MGDNPSASNESLSYYTSDNQCNTYQHQFRGDFGQQSSQAIGTDNVDYEDCSASELSDQDEVIEDDQCWPYPFEGCKKTYRQKRSLTTHVRYHGDEFFCSWHYGALNPLKWMQEYYQPLLHTRQWPNAPLSRVNQGLVILILSGKWEEKRKANYPALMALMANEVRDMMFAGRHVEFKTLTISMGATRNVLRNQHILAFLGRIPASGAALLALNGPECTSVMRSNRAMLAKENVNRTIWIAFCVEKQRVADRVVPTHRGDGSWSLTNKAKGTRAWALFSLHRMMAVWAGTLRDPNYEYLIELIDGALRSRRRLQVDYAEDPVMRPIELRHEHCSIYTPVEIDFVRSWQLPDPPSLTTIGLPSSGPGSKLMTRARTLLHPVFQRAPLLLPALNRIQTLRAWPIPVAPRVAAVATIASMTCSKHRNPMTNLTGGEEVSMTLRRDGLLDESD